MVYGFLKCMVSVPHLQSLVLITPVYANPMTLFKKKKNNNNNWNLVALQYCASAAQWGESAICIQISPPSWTYLPSTPKSHPYIPPSISSQSITELPVKPVASNYKMWDSLLGPDLEVLFRALMPNSLPWSCVKQMTDRIWWINISALSFV